VSRFGNDSSEWRSYSAKLFALLEISQGGTLFIYQGQELGLKNFPESWSLEEYKDAATINFWNRSVEQKHIHTTLPLFSFLTEFPRTLSYPSNPCLRIKERRKAEAKPGEEVDMTDVIKGLQHKARDHSRVPMPVRTLPTSNIDSELTTKCAHLGKFPRSVDRRSQRWFYYRCSLDAGERRLRRWVECAGTARRQYERSRIL